MKYVLQKFGFTLPEIVLTVGILLLLISIVTPTLTRTQRSSATFGELQTVLADIKGQQIKAMIGDTQSQTTAASYGIYFGTNSYTLFKGSLYSSSNPQNIVIPLQNSIVISNVTFPARSLVFTQVSGDVTGYTSGFDTVTIQNTSSGEQKTIRVNRYGVIISVT